MNFSNKVVLITGAGSGIAAGTAQMFDKFCAQLALVDRNEKGLQETAEKCCNSGTPLQIHADLSKEKDVEKIMCETIAKYKKLDVLVNAAGFMETGTIENTSLEQYDRVNKTNIRAPFHLTMLAVPEIKKTKGNIVNISSVCGLRSFPNLLAYNIAKSGVDQFTRCVALELGLYGVRCNAINPGVIITNLHKTMGMNEEAYAKFLETTKNTHALGRAGQVHEAASAICFLASDMASFITGVTLSVDGGRQCMCPR